MLDIGQWSAVWGTRLVWTGLVLGGACLAGHVTAVIVRARTSRPEREDTTGVVRPTVRALAERLPLWMLLSGAGLALTFWPLTPRSHAAMTQVLFVVAVLSVTLTVASLASQLVATHGARWAPGLAFSSLTRNIAWGAVAGLGGLIALNELGVSITPMLTALGVGGLAVALALQEPLANFFAGFFLTLAGQIRVGDFVRLDTGQEGHVMDFSWRSTRLRMLANNFMIVPNAKLAQAVVVNHDRPARELSVSVEVGVDYASDLELVERVAIDVGREVMATVPGAVEGFVPFVRFHTFGESSVDLTVILRAQTYVDQYLVRHEFIKRLHRRFDADGIVIPFPIRMLVDRTHDAA